MLNNCTENGYSFSCFQNIGKSESSVEFEKSCNAKKLNQFGLHDFYNFAERLNESNYLMNLNENLTNTMSEARASRTCMTQRVKGGVLYDCVKMTEIKPI